MFIRVSKVTRDDKSYSYAQVVESYRRKEDGLPAHRVVANLGQLSDLEIQNLKSAINASKNQRRVVIAGAVKPHTKISKPSQNLVYLDLAVLYDQWMRSGIGSILSEAMPISRSKISSASIVAILCMHRCQDPGSKLSATRWYQTTALPELTGVPAESFNNSRIHRALYDLEQGNLGLMAKLPRLYKKNQSNMSALFLDVSDAWFCGNGPSLAQKGLAKDGAIRTKIGIVLLCNRDGFPLRWEVVPGAASDSVTMTKTLDEVKHFPWLDGVPLVCDRAMGRTSLIQKMHEMKITFLTAVSRHEFMNYGATLAKERISFPLDDLTEDEIAVKAGKIIGKSKEFTKIRDDLFATDLGQVEVTAFADGEDRSSQFKRGNRIQVAMDLGQKIAKLVANGRYGSIMAAGASLGLKPGLASKYHGFNKLPEQVQAAILRGDANNCHMNRIEEIALKEKPDKMFEKFYEHVDRCGKNPKRTKRVYNQVHSSSNGDGSPGKIKVRVVAYFNPQMYADQKDRSRRWLKKIEDFEKDLNKRLSNSSNKRNKDSVIAEIDRFIRKKDLLRCFDVSVTGKSIGSRKALNVTLKLNESEWSKRREFDGFSVLVAHPDCKLSAGELCLLYREKDVVEKDFQTIKSVLQIRPIRHRSDQKVKAHVSICMLSLMIERFFRKNLAETSSVKAALEVLHTCHLNKYILNGESFYTITELAESQQKILKKLNALYLGDDDHLLERINRN